MDHDVNHRLFLSQTVPKEDTIREPNEAEAAFSSSWIQYERGACMLAMVRSMLGEKTRVVESDFKKSIKVGYPSRFKSFLSCSCGHFEMRLTYVWFQSYKRFKKRFYRATFCQTGPH